VFVCYLEGGQGMVSVKGSRTGVQAGLLAGATVVGFFFLFDLARLQPLATPLALSARLWGPGTMVVEAPVISQLVSGVVFAGNLLAFTLLHFLVFALLGVAAAFGCEGCRLPLNVGTGALYVLTAGTLCFFVCMAAFGNQLLVSGPGFVSVAMANLCAGAVLGGYWQYVRSTEDR
jgi:hypothetical protein